MADQRPDGRYVFKEPVRAAFLNVIKPSAVMVDGKPKGDPTYNGTFLLRPDSADLKDLKALFVSIARAKWPAKPLTEVSFPLKLGEKKAEQSKAKGKDGSFYLGHVVLNADSKNPLTLSVFEPGPPSKVVELDTPALLAQYQNKFYYGCFVVPQLALVAYAGNGSNIPDCVKAYLQMVMWFGDGTRIGGQDATEVYKDYIGRVTPGVDPTGGAVKAANMDDEIPF